MRYLRCGVATGFAAVMILAAGQVPAGASEGTEPVPCGPVDVGAEVHTLFAIPGPSGTVGCEEAFDVIAEYNALSTGAPPGPVKLSDLWTCVVDDAAAGAVRCVQGEDGVDHGRWFETVPPEVP
ncbi:hypothetical protein L3Q67_34445 [Saccharothrix sp. AJ9571]|nr:hypothetical protein L3Q67_34445 [Saccharothrix sp. AJ9571]